MAKKTYEITITDELEALLPHDQRSAYLKFKEKATAGELRGLLFTLTKLKDEYKIDSKMFAAFKKDLEKTRVLKKQETAEAEKELEKARKEDIQTRKTGDKYGPITQMKWYLEAVIKNEKEFTTKEFKHHLYKCLHKLYQDREYFTDHYAEWRPNSPRSQDKSTIFGLLQDTKFINLAEKHEILKHENYDHFFNAAWDNYDDVWSFREVKHYRADQPKGHKSFKKSRKRTVKDLADYDKKYKYTSTLSIAKEERSANDEEYVDKFSEGINGFIDEIKKDLAAKKEKAKKTAKNNITAEQEVENKTTTAYKQTEEIRDIQDDAYKPRATEVEEFHINIGFDDEQDSEEFRQYKTEAEKYAAAMRAQAYEKEQKRIQELDEEIAYGGYEHWDEAKFDEYFAITNAFKQIEFIKNSPLKDDHQFLIKHFKPEYLALWPEKFSNPDFLNEVSKQANIDDVQKLLFMFTEDPTIFNKYDKTAPKSADKFLALLNTYMQRVAGGKEKDAGSFKNLQYLFDKLYPNGKAICPQLEQYEGFLNSILNKDINYENLKKWKKSLPKQFQKKLEENAKKSRAETLTNKQMDSKLAEIRDAEAPNGKPLDWSKDTIKYFIENAIGSTFNGQPFYSDNVNRMFKVLSPETLEKLDHNFKVSVFNPEFLTKDESRKVFDESVIKDFVRKGSLHEAKRMLFMYAHHREMMPADVYLACLAEFTDRLMTTKNQTERANFYSLRGLCDSLFPEKETGNNPLLPYKNIIENMFEVNEASYAKGYGAWKRSVPKNSVENLKAKAEKAEKARKDKISQEERIKSDPELRSKTFHRETLRKLGQIVTDLQFEKMKTSELEDWVNRLLHVDNNANEDEGDELD